MYPNVPNVCPVRVTRSQPDKSFRSWLSTVTRNAVIAHLQKEKRRTDKGSGSTGIAERLDNTETHKHGDAEPYEIVVSGIVHKLSSELASDLLEQAEPLVQKEVSEQRWAAYLLQKNGIKAKDAQMSWA